MYAVYVLACTLQLTMFRLQCNLSKPDMPSLNQCGKLLNTMCFKQWAVVPVGKRMKHTVILAAALRHMHLLVIKSQNRAGCSFTSTIPPSCGSSKGPEMRCCDIPQLHVMTQTRESDDRQCGMTTVLRGPLLVPVLTVPFLAVHFALNRMRVIPAWLIHKANSPCIRCSTPLCNAGTKDESVQWLEYCGVRKICGQILRSVYKGNWN